MLASLRLGGKLMGLSGMQLIKEILRAMECEGQILVIAQGACPFCGARRRLELNPKDKTYFCGGCGKQGKLEQLLPIVEGLFFRRHREYISMMTSRPRVEKGGGKKPCRPPWRKK